jgi:ABC-type Zn uptake system ZnuABC Zn-binding protein ZnuA
MPLGIDPHAFEPTPKDLVKIAESQVLIINGAGLEEWLEETIANAGGERTVIEASAGLTSREAPESEEAVMSPEDKARAICADLDGKIAEKEAITGTETASIVELNGKGEHETELLLLRLHPAEGGYMGFVKLTVSEGGEYVVAANGGMLTVMDASGSGVAVEETLPVNCAGLSGGILLDLEPGEFVIALSGLAAETTPFFAGPARGDHHHEGDPHFWLDPLHVIKYVENIRDGLIAADPGGVEAYTQNASAYIAQLKDLDAWITQQVSTVPEERRRIVTNHESFGYFADRYGFQIIGTVIPSVSTGASPSAQQMAQLVDHIREGGATTIFLETGSNPKLAEQIGLETGVKVVSELYTHSITGPDGEAPTYIDMMRHNVHLIVVALR